MKTLLILGNKKAGAGSALGQIQNARRKIWGWPCEFHFTENKSEMDEFCSKIDPELHEAVMVLGGDGTFNSLLPWARGKRFPVIPLPAGSANDLSHALNITWEWDDLLEPLSKGQTQNLDLIEVNGHPFITVGGIGIGSKLIQEYNDRRSRSKFQRWALPKARAQIYSFLAAKSILTGKELFQNISISNSEETRDLEVSEVFVCNQEFLGGDLRVAPGASNQDSLMDVVVIPKLTRTRLLQVLKELKEGIVSPEIWRFKADILSLKSLDERPISFFGDGEILETSKNLELKVIPKALTTLKVSPLKEVEA